ncbi:hypothetical protein BJP25_27210 [Actinokineospora bangkokensis]|uniref:DUF397 domain-containing protein n=1 Tax=Actinokineospora bangkokensis TaxID=1193682 RepID=A0A1Q9LH33_9PSEU|nr:hypothetical protein BJP25_27210 [Actinokineospora bangkokensis]
METAPEFRQSSFCASGSCVQVAVLANGRVAMRDGKNPAAPAQQYPPAGWVSFTALVKADGLGQVSDFRRW